ncbi:MAG: hypothetical protein JWQ57_815 [Mucilaginibacter sp.]|nr:hypothetical protein [Mucilaginibacter sp.]
MLNLKQTKGRETITINDLLKEGMQFEACLLKGLLWIAIQLQLSMLSTR